MINKIKAFIQYCNRLGVTHIFRANVINKAVAFCVNMLIVVVLSKHDYGVLNSANNSYGILTLLLGLGTISGVLLYGSEKRSEEERLQFYKYALFVSFVFNLSLSAFMFLYSYFNNLGITESKPYLRMLCFLPVPQYICSFLSTVLRCKKDNKRYSFLLNIETISNSLLTLIGAWIFGIFGAIVGRYLSIILTCVIGLFFNIDIVGKLKGRIVLTRSQKNEFIKYSLGIGFASAVATALYMVDIKLVDWLLADPIRLSEYKVATLIPDSLILIPSSIIVAVLPFFAEHNNDYYWITNQFKKVFKMNLIINLIVTIICIVIAPFFVPFVWGDEYNASVGSFQILCCSFFFLGTFRTLSTNLLSVLRRVKETVVISVLSIIVDVVLDILLIPLLGIIGAAIATVLVSIIASVVSSILLFITFRGIKT